jgi:hypothetical protein
MEQTLLFLASFSSLIIIITPKTPHSFTPTSYYKMSNNNNNEKEREKAKQKNIAVIENAIAARNKVLMLLLLLLLLLCSFLFVYLNKSSHFSKINFSLFSAFASRY